MTKEGPEDELLKEMRGNFAQAVQADEHNRRIAVEALNFIRPGADQWSDDAKRRWKNRPMLTINLLPKYVKQVIGDERQNSPTINIRPGDADADIHIAAIREGMIMDILYASDFDTIKDQAFEQMVKGGYGGWRVLSRYAENDLPEEDAEFDGSYFNEELILAPVKNALLMYLDPNNEDDPDWGLLIEKMPEKAYKEAYPDALAGPSDDFRKAGQAVIWEHWYDKESVTVAEYFKKEYESKTIALLSDGRVLPENEAQKAVKERKAQIEKLRKAIKGKGNPIAPADEPIPEELSIEKTRKVRSFKIKWYKCTGSEILEGPKDWAGKYIPLVQLLGEETNVAGKRYISGMIQNAMDSQRMLNYWYSLGAETISLAPKTPWLGTAKHFEGYENDYAAANVENFPFLKYNIDPKSPMSKPERQPVGGLPTGIFAEIGKAEQNIEGTIGMFKSSVGAPSNERTGIALQLRLGEGDVGMFMYHDNLRRALVKTGKILNDAIPHYYDTQRDVRMRHASGAEVFTPINTTVGDVRRKIAQNPAFYRGLDMTAFKTAEDSQEFNNIGKGKFNVYVTTGPNYTTQRIAAADQAMKIAMASKGMNPLDKYYTVKNLDFMGADQWAEAIRKTLPQGLVPPRPGEPPAQPLPPPPAMQVELEKLKLEQAKVALTGEKVKQAKGRTDDHIKKIVLDVMAELHAPPGRHKADSAVLGGQPNG